MEEFGYVAQKYVVLATNDESSKNDNENKNEITNEIVKVICSGLRIRKEPGTDKIVSGYVEKGALLTRVEQAVSNANGYIWDKIVTSNGIEGYIARGDSNESYIEVVSVIKIEVPNNDTENNNNENTENKEENSAENNNENTENKEENSAENNSENTENKEENNTENNNQNTENKEDTNKKIEDYKNDKMKINSNNLICIPEAKIEDLKELFTDKEVKVTNKENKEITEGNLATGYVINIEEKTYNVVKLGDVNGDGRLTPADSTLILRAYLKLDQISDVQRLATDANNDGKLTPADSTMILRVYLGLNKIQINDKEN